jgi:hypothetical protein
MTRKQVVLEYWQNDYLKFLAKKYSISESEALRRLMCERIVDSPGKLRGVSEVDLSFEARKKI